MTSLPPLQPEREIITIRTLPHPIAKVFAAWSDPAHLQKWWGPNGFSNTFETFDFTPGGRWSFVMHGPDKGHYRNECEFIDIRAPHLIYWKRHSKPLFDVAVTFEEVEDRIKMTFRMIFATAEESEKLRKFVTGKNEENFDRLEAELQQMK